MQNKTPYIICHSFATFNVLEATLVVSDTEQHDVQIDLVKHNLATVHGIAAISIDTLATTVFDALSAKGLDTTKLSCKPSDVKEVVVEKIYTDPTMYAALHGLTQLPCNVAVEKV